MRAKTLEDTEEVSLTLLGDLKTNNALLSSLLKTCVVCVLLGLQSISSPLMKHRAILRDEPPLADTNNAGGRRRTSFASRTCSFLSLTYFFRFSMVALSPVSIDLK